MDRHHVGMVDPCRCAGLDQEALTDLGLGGGDELDRHGPIEHLVLREVDLAHHPAPEQANQPVFAELVRRPPL